jgi:hypothetical protein
MNSSKNIGLAGMPVTQTISNFCAWSNIGRSMAYLMIAAGDIETVRVGKRQLVLTESYLELIEKRRATGPGTVPVVNRRYPPKIARASDTTAVD